MTEQEIKDPFAAFVDLPDEQVVKIAQEKHDSLAQEYLLIKYRSFVRGKARSYFLIGAEREDIIQEGMIGLYKAIRDFRSDSSLLSVLLLSYALPGRL